MTAFRRGIKSIGGWRRPVKKTASFLLALLLTVLLAIPLAPAAFAEEGSELIEITKKGFFRSRAVNRKRNIWGVIC